MDDILLITVDSLRADHVGYHGYEREVTPYIDELAADASVFTRAYAHAGGTKFAFPSILTSVYPLMYGGYRGVSDEQTVVSEVFQDAGYQTGGFHSNLYISSDFGYDRGWDEFFDSKSDASLTAQLRQWAKTNLNDTPIFPLLKRGYDLVESSGGVNVGSYITPADEITDYAIDWIEDTDDDRPSFLWVHYMDVHHPFLPPEEYQREFLDETVSHRDSIKLRRKLIEEPENVTEAELQTTLDLYDAEIRFTDDQIRRLVEAAETQWGDVTTMFTADHGEHFLDHGYFSGAQLMDVKMHVPLFVSGWGDSGEYDDLVGLVDIPPTLVDHAGLDIPETFHGRSLRDLVFDSEWDREEILGGLGLTADDRRYVCRERDWKYIRRPPGTDDELYDLETDPEEQTNVAADHPDVVRRLSKKVDEHEETITATETDRQEADLSEDAKERLRRLGYAE
jgi:arylsulfatase A-like enzyme